MKECIEISYVDSDNEVILKKKRKEKLDKEEKISRENDNSL